MAKRNMFWMVLLLLLGASVGDAMCSRVGNRPHRILLDTDVDTDDFFALLYLLKLNRSEFELEVLKNSKGKNCNHLLFPSLLFS